MRRLIKFALCILLLTILTAGCVPGAPAWTDTKDPVWWKNTTFYEIFVRSFYDSNGDGIGDLKGITQKLDYLNDGKPGSKTSLGVTGIWLMPVNPSPSYHGYDVTDYYGVNSEYGTLDDMRNLVSEAHKRGIKVIIDLVLNHTSVQSPWFVASDSGDPKYRDWYIWSDTKPGYAGPWNETVWYAGKTGYYYSIFDLAMADLNYKNPAVTQEMDKVSTFWLKDVGIDGFRLDAAKHIIEDGQQQENTPATHAWLKTFTAFSKTQNPNAMLVGEVQPGSEEIADYVNNHDLDMVFDFPLAADLVKSAENGTPFNAQVSLANAQRLYNVGTSIAPFLTNHDQTRAMNQLLNDPAKAKNAASLLLTAPGVPCRYYGEEIGMTGDKPDPLIRSPFQWSADANAGMTTALIPWEGVNLDYTERNVVTEDKDPNSILNHYRALIAIRNNHAALRTGAYVEVGANASGVFAALRTSDKESVLVLVNLGTTPVTDLKLSWSASDLKGTYKPTFLMGKGTNTTLAVDGKGGVKDFAPLPALAPGETVIIQYRP
jgi:glycosidase